MVKDNDPSDERFAHVLTDPRFRTLRKSDKKVKIDKRFQKLFTEKRFQLKHAVNKRGKRVKNADSYKKMYDLDDEEEEKQEKQEEDKVVEDKREDVIDNDVNNDEEVAIETIIPKKPKVMNARGDDSDEDSDNISSSSESEEDSDVDDEDSQEIDHNWNEWAKDVPQTEVATKRFAICNIDWDRINATDLFVLINSFKPSGGSVVSVRIFPSEFGLQRMKVEAEKGPIEFIKATKSDTNIIDNDIETSDNEKDENNEDVDDDDEEIKSSEELRKYELERLKYYYAVVECDNGGTADVLYKEIDGMEYESSSSTLDLRFIPDDMTFGDEEGVVPKSECYAMPDMTTYKAPQFINSALQQSKVRMTWDETDPKRKNAFERAFDAKDDGDDLKAYLATSDEEDEEEDDEEINEEKEEEDAETVPGGDTIVKTREKINKYKELLFSLNEPKNGKKNGDNDDDDIDMEVTWEPNLNQMAEDVVEKKERKDCSVFEQKYLENKDKRKQNKRKQQSDDEEEEDEEEELGDSDKDVKESNFNDNNDNNNNNNNNNNNSKKRKNKHKKKNDRNSSKTDPELELLLMDGEEVDEKRHFNYKTIVENEMKKKNNNKPKDSFKFDSDDPRFGAVYTSHHYNVDPSDPHFKRTEAFEQIMKKSREKSLSNERQRQQEKSQQSSNNNDNNGLRSSWTHLVKTVKNKSKQLSETNKTTNKKSMKKFNIKQNKFKS
ncbi:uncharacterized protein LOC128963986 [Oppia nitens]|uniref:uncharacterized protein LOC128963986 n=1 Tax=Oppia nitens TaxID=1686743 RepID=UPI0023DB2FA4|nr:uncharacterized protein LOC128963986 [Oppia nitens]